MYEGTGRCSVAGNTGEDRLNRCFHVTVRSSYIIKKGKRITGHTANGLYRYNSYFALPVYDENGDVERYNVFRKNMIQA